MKLICIINPNQSKSCITEILNNDLNGILKIKISIKSQAKNGKANDDLLLLLSKILKIPKDSIKILSGKSSAKKLINIDCSHALDLIFLLKSVL